MSNTEKNETIKFIRRIVRRPLWGIKYHEGELARAHAELAHVKAMLLRGNYTEFTIADVQAELDRGEGDGSED